MVYGRPGDLDVGRDLAHASSASVATRRGDRLSRAERIQRAQEAVHGGGVHGSGVYVTEEQLNDWHQANSIKYSGRFHPEWYATPKLMSQRHAGMHDATLDFRTAVRGIVPGYAGHVPRARDMYGEPSSGGITPERGWKRAPKYFLGPMGSRAHDSGPEGAASRPHAHTRYHNRVSEEVKPGYAGHVPAARDTHGTSHYRDSFTNPKLAHLEDGNLLSYRSTASSRFLVGDLDTRNFSLGGNASGWKSDRSHKHPTPRQPPGLNDRQRISGRARSAPRMLHGKRVSMQEVTV
jgi:hypothetical protein